MMSLLTGSRAISVGIKSCICIVCCWYLICRRYVALILTIDYCCSLLVITSYREPEFPWLTISLDEEYQPRLKHKVWRAKFGHGSSSVGYCIGYQPCLHDFPRFPVGFSPKKHLPVGSTGGEVTPSIPLIATARLQDVTRGGRQKLHGIYTPKGGRDLALTSCWRWISWPISCWVVMPKFWLDHVYVYVNSCFVFPGIRFVVTWWFVIVFHD